MTPSAIFLLLVVALIAKMIYDVQRFKPLKREKLERARLQFNAGLEVDEDLVAEIRLQGKLKGEKLKKELGHSSHQLNADDQRLMELVREVFEQRKSAKVEPTTEEEQKKAI